VGLTVDLAMGLTVDLAMGLTVDSDPHACVQPAHRVPI